MGVTKVLYSEHRMILDILSAMEQISLSEDPKNNVRLLENLPAFFLFCEEFADELHHYKEETVLFGYLERTDWIDHFNPFPKMLYEHRLLEELKSNAKNHFQQGQYIEMNFAVRQYIHMARDHIKRENNEIFPIAEKALNDPEARASILQSFSYADLKKDAKKLWENAHILLDKVSG